MARNMRNTAAQVDDCHDRREVGGDVGDFLHAAEDNEPVDDKDQNRDDPWDYRAAACKAADCAVDCIDLQRTAGNEGDKHCKDCERPTQNSGDSFLFSFAKK